MRSFEGAIIAAGRGERLRASGQDLPKPLVELGGHALLVRQAREMTAAGASRLLAIVNSETARLIAERALELPAGLELSVHDTANSMESLFELGERLAPGHFLLATVDAVIAREELRAFVARAFESVAPGSTSGLDGALGAVRWRGDRRPLFVEVDKDGLVRRLGGAGTPLVTAGVYVLPTGIFDFKERARRQGLGAMREFLAMLVAAGMRFAAFEVGTAIDIDEAADLEAAREMLAAAKLPRA